MAITPENTVYQGREGTGEAQIFGREGNPLQAVRTRMAQLQQRKDIEYERNRLAKAQRDKEMYEALSVQPEKTFQPFNDQVQKAANEQWTKTADYFNKGGTRNADFDAWNKQQWGKINSMARRGTYIQDAIGKVTKEIDDNPYLKPQKENIMKSVFDMYMNPDGTAKPFDQINEKDILNVTSRPEFYDLDKFFGDFATNAKTNTTNWVNKVNTALGQEIDDVELKASNFFIPDAKTGVKMVNGVPVINVTDEMINAAVDGNPQRRDAILLGAQKEGITPREFVTKRLTGAVLNKGAGFDFDIKPMSKFYPSSSDNKPNQYGIKPAETNTYLSRVQNIDALNNAFFNPDGSRRSEPTESAQAALSQVAKNTKFGNGDVLESILIPGTTDASVTVGGKTFPGSPKDRVGFYVKFPGTKTAPKWMYQDLGAEQGGAINSLFETSKTQGKAKVNWDAAMAMAQGEGIKYGDNNTDFNLQQASQAQSSQIQRWQNFEDLSTLKNKVVDGKRVTSVNRADTPWNPFSKKSLKLTFSDGTSSEVSTDDAAALENLYHAEQYQPPAQSSETKPSSSGIDYSKLKYAVPNP